MQPYQQIQVNINYPENLIINQYCEDEKPRNIFFKPRKDKKIHNIQNIVLPSNDNKNNFNESLETR